MKAATRTTSSALPSGTYVELVTSLCGTRMPAAIMSGLFVMVGSLTIRASHDAWLAVLVLWGVIASAARLIVLIRGRRRCNETDMSPSSAQRFERSFAFTYIAFAAIFGLFAARALALPITEWRMPVGILVVGYAAGAASTIALRPRIVVSSLILSVAPSAAVLLPQADAGSSVSGICLLALLAGGLRSVGQRYRSQALKTTKRQAFALLARTDHLTGLGNRLALAETFETLEGAPARATVAIHYIDLDDFKPVNDQLGHQAGDAVLRIVAERLQSCRAARDLVVRLGGDEFVYVQSEAVADADVEVQAARIESLLSLPYILDEAAITIGASVGSSRYTIGFGMDMLLASADDALRRRKARRKKTRFAAAHQLGASPAQDFSRAA